MFKNSSFIKANADFDKEYTGHNYAPMFRKKFRLDNVSNARLYVCGLGYGYYYINGKIVTEDKFTAPVSDYQKTLWYNTYDVSELLQEGENIVAVWCGNGWYNEEFQTPWDYDKVAWRDNPKFILRLDVDGETKVVSDESWKCNPDSPIWFNALRSGEYFDARKYDSNWVDIEYDDSLWENAIIDETPPSGIFRECKCEPIREFEVYEPVKIIKTGDKRFLYDMGQNISGYIRLTISGEAGQLLTIRYGEQLLEDMTMPTEHMRQFYPESDFQTDKFICSGKAIAWSPKFTYHGFQYIEIEGLDTPEQAKVESVFVHQAIDKRTEFHCSDEVLNRLFKAGMYSTHSNMFYQITDCPTREKLGWTNDAGGTAEQFLTNFKCERLFEKWLYDIYDAMKENGDLPGTVPTAGWGYGLGPVADGALFEIPYRIWLHTGNEKPLIESLPYFNKYLDYMQKSEDARGFVGGGLSDWARPGQWEEEGPPEVSVDFLNTLLIRDFCKIAERAAKFAEQPTTYYQEKADKLKQLAIETYIQEDGRCRINKQTAVAMLIYYDVYEQLEPLKMQLKELIEQADFHHDCGMVGIRRLYIALNKCGLQEYAYRIITADGYPGYKTWLDGGANTLWEVWEESSLHSSKNHHMYSDFMSWMIKTILGIQQDEAVPSFAKVTIAPYFLKQLDYAEGKCETDAGTVAVAWKKEQDAIQLTIHIPKDMEAYYEGVRLPAGQSEFTINI